MKSFRSKIYLKFKYAFEGLLHGILHDSSIRTQCFFAMLAILAGLIFHFHLYEWVLMIVLIGFVVGLEFVNSALEKLCDIVSPQMCEEAKRIKDYAAAAVLVAASVALFIGLIMIGGKLL